MRFRKKPVVVEAVRFLGGERFEDEPAWLSDAAYLDIIDFKDGEALITDGDSCTTAHPGDWIVQGTEGEIYAVSAKVFGDIYEAEDLVGVAGAVAAVRGHA